jgi:hypothetical protein
MAINRCSAARSANSFSKPEAMSQLGQNANYSCRVDVFSFASEHLRSTTDSGVLPMINEARIDLNKHKDLLTAAATDDLAGGPKYSI